MKTTLITADALAAALPGEVLVVDCRMDLADPSRGERDYLAGHLPGAVHASLDRDLSDLSRQSLGLGRHPLPGEEAFSAVLAAWGWRPGMAVVAYDAAGGALAAARLWWLLRLVGEREVAVLDGGLAAWHAAGLPLEAGAVSRPAAPRVAIRFDPVQFIVDHAQVAPGGGGLLLDARAAPRFRGDVEPLDRVGGHVPGARNRPFADNLDAGGRFKPADQLRQEFLAVIAPHAPDAVVHACGSGVTACHNLLAMEVAGLPGSRLYAPSWSGWVSDPARPVATGDA